MSAIDSAELKEMKGKRITIDGERHRVAKIAVRAGTLTTEEGVTVDVDGIYKRGRGYFYDTPKKGKKKPAAESAPAETAAQRRRREKKEAAEAETTSTRGRNRGNRKAKAVEDEDETPRQRRRRQKAEAVETAETAGSKPSKKKKLVESFDQAISERLTHEVHSAVTKVLSESGVYAVTPIAAGARFQEDHVQVFVTFVPSGMSQKAIEKFIRDNREATDVGPTEEEEDDLEDDLEDDDAEDEDVDENPDEEDEDDGELDDDEEDESEDDDEEEEDDESEEEDEVSVDEIIASIVEDYPSLKEDKVRAYVEAYLTNDAVEDKLGDELMPGTTRLQKKGSELELLLVGYDEDEEVVKLVNTETGKFRSASIDDVVRMEIVEEEEEDDE